MRTVPSASLCTSMCAHEADSLMTEPIDQVFDVSCACKCTPVTDGCDAPMTCVAPQGGAFWLAALHGSRAVRQPVAIQHRPRAEIVGEPATAPASEPGSGRVASAVAMDAAAPVAAQPALPADKSAVDRSESAHRARCIRFARVLSLSEAVCWMLWSDRKSHQRSLVLLALARSPLQHVSESVHGGSHCVGGAD